MLYGVLPCGTETAYGARPCVVLRERTCRHFDRTFKLTKPADIRDCQVSAPIPYGARPCPVLPYRIWPRTIRYGSIGHGRAPYRMVRGHVRYSHNVWCSTKACTAIAYVARPRVWCKAVSGPDMELGATR
eukprot:694903-Rhodomonas_salina.2